MKYINYLIFSVMIGSFTLSVEAETTTCSAIEVTSSYLNVRTGHSSRASKVGVIQRGERYIVAGAYGSWKKIWYDNNVRWIYSRYYTKPITTPCGTVNINSLNVRAGPSAYYRNIGIVRKNSKWAIIGSAGEWKKIWYKSEPRWVHGRYLNALMNSIKLTGFNINKGATTTKSRFVRVYPAVVGTPKYYQISENLRFKNANWRSYASQLKYTLSTGNGNKRVYFRVKDNKGRLSNTLYDDIKQYIAPVETKRSIDRAKFYSKMRLKFGRLNQSQVNGINFLLSKIEADKEPAAHYSVWVKQIAYVLSTIKHEVANTYQPITEYSNTTCRRYDGGCTYKGRGYVQLTHRYNYKKLSPVVGVDLVRYPLKALEPKISYRVTSYGMHRGVFTGRKLGQYIKTGKTDYWNARRVVNGTDKATLIRGYAVKFQSILEASAK